MITCMGILGVFAANSRQAYSAEIEELSRAIVEITCGKTVRTGVVVQNRREHEDALILTSLSRIEDSGSIEVEFSDIPEKKWKGRLIRKDEKQDAALLKIKNPPRDIPEICFADAEDLSHVHEVWYFGYRENADGELVVLRAPTMHIQGAYVILSVSLDEKAYGGPVFETDMGTLVGMIQKQKVTDQVCDRVLKSGVLIPVLRGWNVEPRPRNISPPRPSASRVMTICLVPRFGFVRGTLMPFSEQWKWESSKGMSFRLTLELAEEGDLGAHRLGIICSEFTSEPVGTNPMGRLNSVFISPIYSYWMILSETRGKRFGAEATFGFALGRHSLEDGEFPVDTLFSDFVFHEGMKDTHFEFFTSYLMGAALTGYFTNRSAVHLGCDVYRFSMRGHSDYYYSFYIGASLRVNP